MTKEFRDYKEALDFLFAQLPMYQKTGSKAMRPGLDNITALLEAMGQPHHAFPSIHIAGTNGKGSVSHMIASILQAAGLKVGLYTSPHYKDFRERMKINGTLISEQTIVAFLNKYRTAIEKIQPSYFELTVALAFYLFKEETVDVAVIETGLGGLLDSTNVLAPLVSVITNISYDHQDILGDTLEEIAFQKAGIIKQNTPVVIGETHPKTKSVFEDVALKKSATISFADQHLKTRLLGLQKEKMILQVERDKETWFRKLTLDAAGAYQIKNLQTALATILQIKQHFKINDDIILNGLSQLRSLTYFIGRWQVLANQPTIIADSGHNEAGIKLAMEQLQAYTFEKLHLVIGFSSEKDHAKILALLPEKAHYYFVKPNVPRGLALEQLQHIAIAKGFQGTTYASVKEGILAAKQAANDSDFIYIGGSSFVVAEALELNL